MPEIIPRTLLLMRHAEAPNSPRGDKFRSLSDEGHEQAQAAGVILKKLGLAPSQILCSPALRIEETRNALISAWDAPPAIVTDERIYHASYGHTSASLLDYYGQILVQGDDSAACLMLLGHNPSIADLALTLCDGGSGSDYLTGYASATVTVFRTTAQSWALLAPENCVCEKILLGGTRLIELI